LNQLVSQRTNELSSLEKRAEIIEQKLVRAKTAMDLQFNNQTGIKMKYGSLVSVEMWHSQQVNFTVASCIFCCIQEPTTN
jgi:hypothetical protein